MKICGVYKITSPSGRIYIGSAKDIYRRWSYYKRLECERQPRLYNSFIKYGVENHTFEIVAIEKFENILKYEHILGVVFNVLDTKKGLNSMLPSYDDIPFVCSEELRHKRSINRKGAKHTEEAKLKMSITRKSMISSRIGTKHSEESKLKMSESAKGRIISTERRLKNSIAHKGKKRSEETKARMREAWVKRKTLLEETNEDINENEIKVIQY